MNYICLRDIAFTRAGDKGNSSNVMVAPYDPQDYSWLVDHLTVQLVRDHFGSLVQGTIDRYLMPGTSIMNFFMTAALQGGVSRSLALDAHGKTRASLMLSISIHATEAPPSLRGSSDARPNS